MKKYIYEIGTERDSEGFGKRINVDFDSKKEEAGFWATRQKAEMEAAMLDQHEIEITTLEGQKHVCRDYKVEERTPREFVICVDAPFKPDPATAA